MPDQIKSDTIDVSALTAEKKEELLRRAGEELGRRVKQEKIRYVRIKPYQNPFVNSKASIDAAIGGNRSGKTLTAVYRFICILLGEEGIEKYGLPRLPVVYPKPPFDAWVVSEDFTTSREVAQPKFLEFIPGTAIKPDGIKYREKSAVDFVRLKGGRRVVFKSCDSGWQKFQGADIPLIFFDEEPDELVFKECMIRVGAQKRYIIIAMTPLQGETWLVEMLNERAADPNDDNYELHKYFTMDNDSLAPGEMEKMRDIYPEDEWLTRTEGVPMARSGLVFPEFRYDIHVYPDTFDFAEIFDTMDWYFFVDYGSHHPMAIYMVGVDSRGSLYIHDESYVAGEALPYHALRTRAMYDEIPHDENGFLPGHNFVMMYCDPSMLDGEKTKNKRQSLRQQFASELIEAGVETAVMPGNNDVHLGIQTVKKVLTVNPDRYNPFTGEMGAPGLFVNRRCQKWIWEIRRHRWHESRKRDFGTDSPVKIDDHAMSATRYGCTRLAGIAGGKNTRRRRNRTYHPILGST